MSDTPPLLGQDPWGADLNTYLASLETRIAALGGQVTALSGQVTTLTSQVAAQGSQVTTQGGQIAAQGAQITTQGSQIITLGSQITELDTRTATLEAKADLVYESTPYQFSNAAPPATGNQLRLDNANPSLATLIDVRLIDSEGADRSFWFRALGAGAQVRIGDWDNASVHHLYDITGTATLDATNAQIPVAWVTGTGTIPNAKINVGFLVRLQP